MFQNEKGKQGQYLQNRFVKVLISRIHNSYNFRRGPKLKMGKDLSRRLTQEVIGKAHKPVKDARYQ